MHSGDDLPRRKQIRLPDYNYAQNDSFFITICTHNRTHLFGEIVGAHLCVRPGSPHLLAEKWLFALEEKYPGVRIETHIIMPDHIHFILSITQPGGAGAHTGAPLPELIKWFKTQSTNDYIKAVKGGLLPPFVGHIWQRDYYEHVIRNQQDFQEIWSYIETNPMRWEKETLCP